MLGDTDAEAADIAREVRRAQVSPQTALRFIEQLWNSELPDFDVDGPLPGLRPGGQRHPHRQGPRQRAAVRQGPGRAGQRVARPGRRRRAVGPRGGHRGDRPPVVHRLAGDHRAAINELVQADAADGYILVPHITPAGLEPFVDKVVPLLQERGVFRADYTGTTLRDHLGLAPLGRGQAGRPAAAQGRVMRFITITLIVHAPDPFTGAQKSTRDRFREVIDSALLAEELGFDGFGVGERHERPFISSSPTVVLSHLAALTSRIRLFTAVTTLSLLDPVRAFEDYATLDHLSAGRLELIIGKGNGAAQRDLFHVTPEDQWDRNAESYEVFRRLWQDNKITYDTRFRPPLPRPRCGRGPCSGRSGSGTAAPPARSRSTWRPATATRCSPRT